MNIYLHELKSNIKFVLIWLVSIMGMVLLVSSLYPYFNSDIKDFMKIIDNLPNNIRLALGMNSNTIGSILGYYTFMLNFIFVCGAIESMILGMSILSKEIRERTCDFLLSKPVSRIKIVTSKILASLTLLIVSNIIWFIGFYLILLAFTNISFSFTTYALLTITIMFIQIIFFSLGLLLSVIIPKVKAILPISLGSAFGFYLLSTFTDEKYRIFMPYKYFDTTQILLKSKYEFNFIIVASIVVSIFIILTYVIYKNKDIDAV